MRKILLYIFLFIMICFIIPIIFTKRNEEQVVAKIDNNIENNIQSDINKYDYKNYSVIKLLHAKENIVQEISLDEYLYGVVSSEMPASFEKEALKAQAIVARTYTIFKVQNNTSKHENADICDDSTCCQAWISKDDRLAKWEEGTRQENWNKIVDAVDSTKGKIITYEGKPINAFFHASSGGTTEEPVNVWGGSNLPYLQVVETAGEEGYSQYASEVTFTQDELIEKLKTKYSDIKIDFESDEELKILEHTESNRVKTIKFGNHELSGVEARTLLGLKSTNFIMQKENGNIKFSVTGYGHGVGMSQTGADAMAKQGNNYEAIIKHFYTGVEIKEVNLL